MAQRTITNNRLSDGANVGALPAGMATAPGGSTLFLNADGSWTTPPTSVYSTYVVVGVKSDFPSPAGGIIQGADSTFYFVVADIDLTGDRIVLGTNTAIGGTSSETASLSSTGLVGTALITGTDTFPLRHISITADVALDLDGISNPFAAIDWNAVNFVSCGTLGTIKNYNNLVYINSAIISSGTLTLDGTFNTVAIDGSLLSPSAASVGIDVLSTCTINRRFRVIYSSFVVAVGETGINVADLATTFPNPESFILDTVNFSGGGTYLAGVDYTDNQSLIVNCVGVQNSATIGQGYMTGNATATTVALANTYYKAAGTTTAGQYIVKFTHSNNRLTYTGAFSSFFKVRATVTLQSSNNNDLGIRVAVNGVTSAQSTTLITVSGTGDYVNATVVDIVLLNVNDYVEIWVENKTGSNNITVTDLNMTVEKASI